MTTEEGGPAVPTREPRPGPRLRPMAWMPLSAMLAAPVLLVFAILALTGLLSPLAALLAGATLLAGLLAGLWRHLHGLSRLAAHLQDLRAGRTDPPGRRQVATASRTGPRPDPAPPQDIGTHLESWATAGSGEGGTGLPPRAAPRPGLAALDELAGAVDDLCDRQAARLQALSQALLAADRIPDTLPDPLLVLDGQRRVMRANRRAREMFAPAVGQDLAYAIRHPKVLDMVTAVLAQGPDRAETEFGLGDPDRIFGAQCVRYGTAGSRAATGAPAAILLLHEVTALKRTEQMRADFVANASHELKTPLASLIGFIETLRGPARDDPEAQERFLAIMAEQADRMGRLVQDLLSLSQIELNEYSPPTGRVDLGAVARKVAKAQQVQADSRAVRLAVAAEPGLPMVLGDRDQIEQILQNLVDNAIKYGREGGRVDIAIQPAPPPQDDRPGGGNRNAVMLAVSDQGNGIPREHLPRLTERFYRVDQARSRALGGTGLGLAIVKHIVSRHRGSLTIRSLPGIGSTFTIILPAAAEGTTGDGGDAGGRGATG